MRLKPGQPGSGQSGGLVDMQSDELRLKAAQGAMDLVMLYPPTSPPENLTVKTLEYVKSRILLQAATEEKKTPDQPL